MAEHIQEQQHSVDRTGWPKGEWDSEPDRKQFAHAGLACLLVRNRLGGWCGYVGVPENHLDFERPYQQIEDVDVHGGLTYSDLCGGAICHVPEPGMPERVWWLGFDCGHAGDLLPRMLMFELQHGFGGTDETYRAQAYAERETRLLAEQLAAKP